MAEFFLLVVGDTFQRRITDGLNQGELGNSNIHMASALHVKKKPSQFNPFPHFQQLSAETLPLSLLPFSSTHGTQTPSQVKKMMLDLQRGVYVKQTPLKTVPSLFIKQPTDPIPLLAETVVCPCVNKHQEIISVISLSSPK